jgi:hypothetical protein
MAMDEHTLTRVFTLKTLSACHVTIETETVYESDMLILPTVKKWCWRFMIGKTSLETIWGLETSHKWIGWGYRPHVRREAVRFIEGSLWGFSHCKSKELASRVWPPSDETVRSSLGSSSSSGRKLQGKTSNFFSWPSYCVRANISGSCCVTVSFTISLKIQVNFVFTSPKRRKSLGGRPGLSLKCGIRLTLVG